MCLRSAAGRRRVAGSRGWRASEEGAGWGRGASSEPQPGASAPPRQPSRRPSSLPPRGLARPCGEGRRQARAGRPVAATVSCLSLSSPPRAWSRGFPEEELRGTGRGSGSVGAAGSRPSFLPPSLPLSSRLLSAGAEDRLLVNPGRDGWPRLLGWLRETRGAWQEMSPVLLSPLGYFESS